MKYRDKIELAAEMLSACLKAEKKTRVMNHCNLNFKQLYAYLNMLVGSGLMSFDAAVDSYSTTEKGKSFLRLFRSYKQCCLQSEKKIRTVKDKKRQLESMFLSPIPFEDIPSAG